MFTKQEKKSICFLHRCKGNRGQELHLPVPRNTEAWTDLLDICKKHNFILDRSSLYQSQVFFPLFFFFPEPPPMHLFLTFQSSSFERPLLHLWVFSPHVLISDLLRSKSCGFLYFPAFHATSLQIAYIGEHRGDT